MSINDLNNSEIRTSRLKKQIIFSFILKIISAALNFLLVPVLYTVLGNNYFGIWAFLLTLVSWISIFDIGIGNGLRNKLTEAISLKKTIDARKYISTAYITVSAIGLLLILISVCLVNILNWEIIFNTKESFKSEFKFVMLIYFISIILTFILNLINSILSAFQLSSLTNLSNIIANILFYFLLLFNNSLSNDLYLVVSMYCSSLIFSYTLVTIIFFYIKSDFRPSYLYYEKDFVKGLLSLGGSFFIIQIAVLLIFSVDNFIILQLLGPNEVSKYNIAFRLFSILTIFYGIIMAPLWSAYTEAYLQNDFSWILSRIKILNRSIIMLILFIIIIVIFNKKILDVWINNDEFQYPELSLLFSLSVYVILSVWNNIYSFFLNGINQVRLQVKTAILGITLNVPLAYLFVKEMNFGVSGVVWAMNISLLSFSILGPIKSYKILNSRSSNSVSSKTRFSNFSFYSKLLS